jgi:hypothetical protein
VQRWLPGAAAALVVVAAVVVGVLARHSSQPRHSPGPTIPVEITASVNGMPHTLGANVKVAAGSRVRLSAHIQAPTGASIRHGYLYVASPPYGNSPNGPTGNSRILAYQVGALTDNTIAANWLAAPAFGHKTLTVGLQFDYFNGSLSAGMGYVLIQIVVS